MPRIETDGFSLHYLSVGQGPDVILIHGLTSNLAFWYPKVAAGLASSYRVTLFDLRGHGYSGMPPSGYTTRDIAMDVKTILDQLDVERVYVVGHSFGATVGLHFAALEPERVLGLVVGDARVRSLQPAQTIHHWPQWKMMQERFLQHGINISPDDPNWEFRILEELARQRLNGSGHSNGHAKPGNFFVPFLSGSRARAQQWLKLISETTAIEDFLAIAGLTPETLAAISQPTLAMYGEWSHCLPTMRGLAGSLPDCRPIVVKGVGHFHPLLKPNIFLHHVRRFFRGLEFRRAPEYQKEKAS
jgi:pimeloyl-ACP methyl ester carboxylesterase